MRRTAFMGRAGLRCLFVAAVALILLSGCPARQKADSGASQPPGEPTGMTAPAQPGPPPGLDTASTPPPQAQNAPTEFGEARSHAQQASCSSNLKQIALGMLMYVQDYDERFPPPAKWHSGIVPYVQNENLFRCPSDGGFAQSSYAMNRGLANLGTVDIARPAETVMNFESGLHTYNAFDLKGDVGASLARPPRHPSGNNFAFVDGHVKASDQSPERAWWAPQAPASAPKRHR